MKIYLIYFDDLGSHRTINSQQHDGNGINLHPTLSPGCSRYPRLSEEYSRNIRRYENIVNRVNTTAPSSRKRRNSGTK